MPYGSTRMEVMSKGELTLAHAELLQGAERLEALQVAVQHLLDEGRVGAARQIEQVIRRESRRVRG